MFLSRSLAAHSVLVPVAQLPFNHDGTVAEVLNWKGSDMLVHVGVIPKNVHGGERFLVKLQAASGAPMSQESTRGGILLYDKERTVAVG
jgi:hypothetical protein